MNLEKLRNTIDITITQFNKNVLAVHVPEQTKNEILISLRAIRFWALPKNHRDILRAFILDLNTKSLNIERTVKNEFAKLFFMDLLTIIKNMFIAEVSDGTK